jgi:hypothetical protein
MSYPASLPVHVSSTLRHETDRRIERASNGAARGRVFYSAAKRLFRVEHVALDAAALASLLDFHVANMASEFDFLWPLDGVVYRVIFAADPDIKPIGARRANASVSLQEV